MERRRLLLLTSLVLILLADQATAATAQDRCSLVEIRNGGCPTVSTGPNGVDIGAEVTTGGSGGGSDSPSGGGDSDGPADAGGAPGGGTVDPREITDTLGTCRSDRCGDDGGDGAPAVTLADLASFTPATPGIHMEPDGWMLRGLPANFIADSTTNTHDGTLFDIPVTVRFTPDTYRWNWGDGTSDTVTTPGATWESLDQDRFTETPTSHTFMERGTTTITLHVDYTIEYRITADGDGDGDGDGTGTWTTVTGTVAASTALDAYVGTATTVIVPDDCNADPTGVGC